MGWEGGGGGGVGGGGVGLGRDDGAPAERRQGGNWKCLDPT